MWEPACGTQPGFMAADGSGAAARLTGGCGVPGSQGPTGVPPVQGRWALSPAPVLPGDIHLPSMTGCWKVPLPRQALLYKRSRAEVMLPALLPHLTLRALPEPTVPTGRAMAARVWDIEGLSQPGCWCFPMAVELAGTRQPMLALGWVLVRKEAETLSQSVSSCPCTLNEGPRAPWILLSADLGAFGPFH